MPWDQKRRTPSDYLHPKKRSRILTRDAGMCIDCGHPGATGVDHRIPWAEWTHPTLSVHDPSNLAAIHDGPCPLCERDCHGEKTKAEAARGRARAQQRRNAAARRPREQHPGAIR